MKIRNLIRSAICIVVVLICSTWMLASSGLWLTDDDPPQYSDWSAPVNLGPVANTGWSDLQPCISKDGLSLYFVSASPDHSNFDILVSQRASVEDPWGLPQNLGPNINSPYDEGGPALSPDGHRLYFHSTRPGGFGSAPDNDLYVSRRYNKRDDFGWQFAENLGSGVNAIGNDVNAAIFEDDATGAITLYFQSNRPGGVGGADIWASTLQPDETFGTPVLVVELSSPFQEQGPNIRRDGLEMYFSSNQPGGYGAQDLWVSTRPSTVDPWSTPVNLGPVVNSALDENQPALSFDGTALYFGSNRPGFVVNPPIPPHAQDTWVSTRTKMKQPD